MIKYLVVARTVKPCTMSINDGYDANICIGGFSIYMHVDLNLNKCICSTTTFMNTNLVIVLLHAISSLMMVTISKYAQHAFTVDTWRNMKYAFTLKDYVNGDKMLDLYAWLNALKMAIIIEVNIKTILYISSITITWL